MRLIDADNLMDFLRGNVLIDVTPALEDAVSEITTAYDMDVVVKLIQKEAEQYDNPVTNSSDFRNYCRGIATGYRYAIEIIKAGGVNEQSITDSF